MHLSNVTSLSPFTSLRMSIHGIVVIMLFQFITECMYDNSYMRSMRRITVNEYEIHTRWDTGRALSEIQVGYWYRTLCLKFNGHNLWILHSWWQQWPLCWSTAHHLSSYLWQSPPDLRMPPHCRTESERGREEQTGKEPTKAVNPNGLTFPSSINSPMIGGGCISRVNTRSL